ncbi:MAG: YraN family protein [Prolixibacteraceae bacterium]|nr:YraN family protein [Prolixibacteraceae bacterium]
MTIIKPQKKEPDPFSKKGIGKHGEDIAVEYLKSKGYKIIERNWRCHHYEVDIIARNKENLLIIVEVKTRTTPVFGEPYEAVGKKKEQNLINAAEVYIYKNKLRTETRFDIISIIIIDGKYHIDHIKDAFFPTL